MAYNDQCKFTSALITLNVEELKAAYTAGTDPDKIIDLLRDDLTAFKDHPDYASIPAQWRPASFAIIPAAFDENNGLVNSTLKLVRRNVTGFYKSRIDEIYATGTADPHLAGNREALKVLLK
jgi:long-chain acyl-CoA synthetase